jgi:hypothetical protein
MTHGQGFRESCPFFSIRKVLRLVEIMSEQKDLATFLKKHKVLVDTVIPTSSGWIIRLSPMQRRHTKFVCDLEKGWRGSWLGKEANAVFIPRRIR